MFNITVIVSIFLCGIALADDPVPPTSGYWWFSDSTNYTGKAVEATKHYTSQAINTVTPYVNQVVEWTKEDLSHDGKWRYQVVTARSVDALQEALDQLGNDGWECDSPRELEGKIVLSCKKALHSVITNVMGTLIKRK